MQTYTAAEAAESLAIAPKLLRRLLREDHTLQAPGSGSTWVFTDEHMDYLQTLVDNHSKRPKGSKTHRTTAIRDDAGLPADVCRSRTRSDRAKVRALSAERVDRLETALRAAGLHISQLREADGRRWTTQAEDAAEAV
jgi:hypothetical protein